MKTFEQAYQMLYWTLFVSPKYTLAGDGFLRGKSY